MRPTIGRWRRSPPSLFTEALPDDERFAASQGNAQYRMALYDDARRTLERAVERIGADALSAEARAFLSMTRSRLDRVEAARSGLHRCNAALAVGRWELEEAARSLRDEARELLALPVSERKDPGFGNRLFLRRTDSPAHDSIRFA